jgi:hypothetical protein
MRLRTASWIAVTTCLWALGCSVQASVTPLPTASVSPTATPHQTMPPSSEPPIRPTGGAVTATAGVITNSGSTNTYGYTILVGSDGSASYTSGAGRGNGVIAADLSQRFFSDLSAAKPLSALPAAHCAKSASFGTTTTVTQGGDTSPDLQCPGDPRTQALADDVTKIAQSLGVQGTPRSSGSPPPPLPGL